MSQRNRGKYNETIEGLCLRCGRNNHYARDCRIERSKLKCEACNKIGHVQKVCIDTLSRESSQKSANQIQDVEEEDYSIYNVVNIFQNNDSKGQDAQRYYITINIEGKPVKFEVDSGSGYTFLPRDIYQKLQLKSPLTRTNRAFRSYTQDTFIPDGKICVEAKYKGCKITDEIFVVPNFFSALVGRS